MSMADANQAMVVDLSGKVALVTGASQGLGEAMAVRLGRAGAKVACVARGADKLAAVVEQITAAGGEAAAAVTVRSLRQETLHRLERQHLEDTRTSDLIITITTCPLRRRVTRTRARA